MAAKKKSESLYDETKRKTEYLLKKVTLSEIEIYELIKFFFKKFLKKDHELTCEELKSELNGIYLDEDVRADLKKFLDDIHFMEFSNKEFTQDELKLLAKEFDCLIDRFLAPKKEKKMNVFSRKNKKEFSEYEAELKKLEEDEKQKTAKTAEERIQILVRKTKLLIKNKDIRYAKEVYRELLTEYELSHKDIKKIVYPDIRELFKQLE